MMRIATALTLLLLHCALFAQELDFVKPFSSIERAPLTNDTLGRMFGAPPFARLQRPVAVGAYSGIVYIFDAGPNLFYRFDLFQETLQELPQISGALKGVPAGITVAADRSFYVADPAGRQVIHGSLDGQVLRTLRDDANLANPVAIALDPLTSNVVVADSLYDHIVGFNHDGWLLYGFGQRGMGPQQFQLIVDMTTGPQGLYVVDRLNPFIKIYTPEGKFIYGFTRREVANPAAIAVDWRDRVYVADSFDDTIKVYVKEKYVGEIGGTGSGQGRFRFITDLYINQNFLYVADSMNGRVQVFVIDPHGTEKPQEKKSESAPMPEQAPLNEGAPTP
jgi:DNA-binding beta-propeller fold protein YncE